MGLLSDIAGSYGDANTNETQANRLVELGTQAKADLIRVGQESIDGTAYKGAGVVSNTGNAAVDANGNVVSTLSAAQQANSDAALATSTGLFGQAGQSIGSRTDEIYGAASAAFQPEFMRQNTQVANDLYSSGRTGFGGGSSEQYANRQSQEQSLLNAYFGARGQATSEQTAQVTNATNALKGSQIAEASLFNNLGTALTGSELAHTAQVAGVNQNTQLNVTGIQTELQANKAAANLNAQTGAQQTDLLGNVINTGVLATKGDKSFIENLIELF